MLALNLLPGTGLGCFSLGALLEAFLLCAQQRNLNIVSITQVVPMQLWPNKMHRAGCSINQALITVRQAQTTFGCVELKYFEKVCAAGMTARQ